MNKTIVRIGTFSPAVSLFFPSRLFLPASIFLKRDFAFFSCEYKVKRDAFFTTKSPFAVKIPQRIPIVPLIYCTWVFLLFAESAA